LEGKPKVPPNFIKHLVCGFLWSRNPFKQALDSKLGGFPLGFWFAQQGSIYVFVILIFVYVHLMNKLDKKYGYDEE
jgi:putative solute:sodium symporter small subunit